MHFIELIIFGVIALLILTKLFSILGNVDSEFAEFHKEQGKKYRNHIINGHAKNLDKNNLAKEFDNICIKEEQKEIIDNYLKLTDIYPNFSLNKFINQSKSAFELIVAAVKKQDNALLNNLVDAKYLDKFLHRSEYYNKYKSVKENNMYNIISELYMFGNNAFVKVIFSDKKYQDNKKSVTFAEEWTFTKKLNDSDKVWYLCNIEKPHI